MDPIGLIVGSEKIFAEKNSLKIYAPRVKFPSIDKVNILGKRHSATQFSVAFPNFAVR